MSHLGCLTISEKLEPKWLRYVFVCGSLGPETQRVLASTQQIQCQGLAAKSEREPY
jgi:hypothetical protein